MLKLNSELKNEAIAALDGRWGMAAILTFVYLIIAGCLSSIPWLGALISLLISWPLAYGYNIIFYDLLRERKDIEIGCLLTDSRTLDVSGVPVSWLPFIRCCGPCYWSFRVLSKDILMQ